MSARPSIDRRIALRSFGAALLGVPLARVLGGCSSAPTAATTADAATDAGTASDATTTEASEASATAWATGGTASMTAVASYPNPFAGDAPTTCALACEMTQGPCWDSKATVRRDISDGQLGLPMRMMMRVLDDTCAPVANATVEVWHVSPVGEYSGDDSANMNVAYCTGGDNAIAATLYFRGKQVTDASGVVAFDSCFPGWYSGRTIHVHFTVSVGADKYVTSQLFFADALDDEIVGGQPIYDARGHRDTTNASDNVVGSAKLTDYLFATQRMSDGAMLAWKTIVVRASLAEASCTPT
jgi:protocatechuate 3,4-dioxygenase beta subunit